jgi:hypothetical protein
MSTPTRLLVIFTSCIIFVFTLYLWNFYFLVFCPSDFSFHDKRLSWFGSVKPGHRIENFNIVPDIAAVFEEPVDVPDIPHQEWEGTGVIAGD